MKVHEMIIEINIGLLIGVLSVTMLASVTIGYFTALEDEEKRHG